VINSIEPIAVDQVDEIVTQGIMLGFLACLKASDIAPSADRNLARYYAISKLEKQMKWMLIVAALEDRQ
jgi:hypothetical protein